MAVRNVKGTRLRRTSVVGLLRSVWDDYAVGHRYSSDGGDLVNRLSESFYHGPKCGKTWCDPSPYVVALELCFECCIRALPVVVEYSRIDTQQDIHGVT